MRKLPPLNAIRAFEAAARHVSFTKAAAELGVTQGAISKQIAALESWLTTPLFIRTASQLRLTDSARSLLSSVTPALDRIALTAQQLQQPLTTTALRINAPPTFTMRWLIPRISAFQKTHPDIDVRLTTATAPVNFLDNAYDIAIRGADQAPAGVHALAFMRETIVPVCHPDLLERNGLQSAKDLGAHTLISYDTEPLTWADWCSAAGVAGLRPPHRLSFEQMYFALQAAIEGLGVVLVPLFLVADDIITGSLCAPLGTLAARQRSYYACSAPRLASHPSLEQFSQWLRKQGADTEQSIALLANTMAWPGDLLRSG